MAHGPLVFICSMMGLLICKYEPFLQEVSVDTQVTVKAGGLLVHPDGRTDTQMSNVVYGPFIVNLCITAAKTWLFVTF